MQTQNTYYKYCPNVFLAKTEDEYSKGDEIIMTTRRGKENICIVHNLIASKDGFNYYSITRADGFNNQKRAEKKVDRLEGFAQNADKRSDEYWKASNEGKDFLALGEPIKVGHHSEKRHRALIERNHNRMNKCIQERDKAEDYRARQEYWESMSKKIDLSMPKSIEFFAEQLKDAIAYHEGLKDGSIKREHSFSLTYANKKRKELENKVELSKKLWA